MSKSKKILIGLIGLGVLIGTPIALDLAQGQKAALSISQNQLSFNLSEDVSQLKVTIYTADGSNEVLYSGSAKAGELHLKSQLLSKLSSAALFMRLEMNGQVQISRLSENGLYIKLGTSALAAGGDCSTLTNWALKTYVGGDQVTEGGNIYECKAYPYSGWCGSNVAYKPESGYAWADAWTKVGACGTTGSSSSVVVSSSAVVSSSSVVASSAVLSSVAPSSSVAASSVTVSSAVVSSSSVVASSAVLSSSSVAPSSAVLSSSAAVISCTAYATWKSTTSYAAGAMIQYSGKAYKALLAGKNKNPSTNPTYWALQGTCGTVASSSSVATSSSSTTTCSPVVVTGYNFNVTSGSVTAAGYQQNNYPAFTAGDKVIIEGRPCSEATTVAAQPAGDTWNLYFTAGYLGASGTNVRLAKVSGTVSTSSSSVVASSSSVVLSSSSVNVSASPLGQLITKAQFDAMFPNRSTSSCGADGANLVYTYENFITAAAAFPLFGQDGSDDQRKREIAAFLGQISHETTGGGGSWCGGTSSPTSSCFQWGLCYTEEVGCNDGTCNQYNANNSTYPAVSGHSYHGRGPIQLSWNYNYGPASQALFGDKMILLNNPDMVKNDGVVAFKTAMWFWMTAQSPKPSSHDVIVEKITSSQVSNRPVGYGLVTNIINGGIECGSSTNISKQDDRVNFFKNHASKLGVSPKPATSTLTDAQYFYCTTQNSF